MKLLKTLAVLFLTLINIACLQGSESQISIVIKKGSPEVVKFAARELQDYLKKISGKKYPVITDDKNVSGRIIMVGQSRYTDKFKIRKKFEPDAFIIKSAGANLVLAGDDLDKGRGNIIPFDYRTSRKGSLFAVYTFLEKFYGVRWYWPGKEGEVVPEKKQITIPENADIYEKPAFLWRYCWFVIATDQYPSKVKDWEVPVWCMRNKMGISIGSPWSFSHSWGRYLTNKHFAKHPEYYALVDGKRIPLKKPFMSKQVCTSNPEVVRIFADRIRKGRKSTDDAIVSISPNDGLGFCECANCKALDHPELYSAKEGYKGIVLSDRIYTFVNKVAREVKKTHPDLRIGIFSYTVVRPIPRALKKLENNVVISMTQTNAHYRNKKYKQYNRQRLEEWKRMCSAFVGRDYLGNYSFAGVMHPQTKIIAEDLRFMKANNYIGFYSECSMDFAANFLNYYITAKLTWNPDANVDKIVDDMCRKAYGTAADKMKEFYSLMETSFNNCSTVGIHPGNIPDWYSEETLQKAFRLLEDAEKTANTDAVKKRIRYNMAGLEYTEKVVSLFRIYRRLCDSGLPMGIVGYTPDFSKKYSREQIVSLLKSAKKTGKEITAMLDKHKGSTLLQPYPFQRQNSVKRWFKTVDEYLLLYGKNSKDTEISSLPIEWKFKTDPQNIGLQQKWFMVKLNDSSWKKIRTDSNWEKQGYPKYDGYAWYRQNIRMPETITGKYVLRIGAVDESCWIYVNGKLAGQYIFNINKDPDGWKKAHDFNITKNLHPGNNNITIRVHDTKFAGGIWKRVFLINKKQSVSKIVFSEDFDTSQRVDKLHKHLKDANIQIEKQALNIQVNKPFPAACSITLPRIKVSANKDYMITIAFKSNDVKENIKEKKFWLKKPRLPNARIIFLDKKNKTCVSTRKYVWFGGKFKEHTNNWELLRKVFQTPANADNISLTLFFNAQGNYWIDKITIEEL
jgi:hypothetical protein